MLKFPEMFLINLTAIIQGHLEAPGFLPKRALGVIICLASKDANFCPEAEYESLFYLHCIFIWVGGWAGEEILESCIPSSYFVQSLLRTFFK